MNIIWESTGLLHDYANQFLMEVFTLTSILMSIVAATRNTIRCDI